MHVRKTKPMLIRSSHLDPLEHGDLKLLCHHIVDCPWFFLFVCLFSVLCVSFFSLRGILLGFQDDWKTQGYVLSLCWK
jgi:hypothetical protein